MGISVLPKTMVCHHNNHSDWHVFLSTTDTLQLTQAKAPILGLSIKIYEWPFSCILWACVCSCCVCYSFIGMGTFLWWHFMQSLKAINLWFCSADNIVMGVQAIFHLGYIVYKLYKSTCNIIKIYVHMLMCRLMNKLHM